jgi:DNA-binding helix-hairpin-helix protein with protein kinase domain
MCANIAIAVHSIHATQKYVFVDLNPRNILVTSEGKISIIDTDSMQVKDGATLFHGPVSTPDYTPPESIKITPKKDYIPQSWDTFQLAVLFYEIIMGINPYAASNKPPHHEKSQVYEKITSSLFVHGKNKHFVAVMPPFHNNFSKLPAKIQNLFIAAFDIDAQNASQRPTAEVWAKTIIGELKNAPSVHPTTQKKKYKSSSKPKTSTYQSTTVKKRPKSSKYSDCYKSTHDSHA